MSYSTYDLNARIANIQASIAPLIPIPSLIPSLRPPPTPNELVVVDTIVVADIYPAPTETTTITPNLITIAGATTTNVSNNQIDITNGSFTSTNTSSSIGFFNSSTGEGALYQYNGFGIDDGVNYTIQMNQTNLTMTQTSTSNYSSLGYDGFIINDVVSGESNTVDKNSISMIGPSGGFNQLVLSNDISVTEPFLRLDNSIGNTTNYLASALNQSSNQCYTFDNGTRFFKQNNPSSMKQYELVDGDFIEPYMPFVMIQNGNAINLHRVGDYLDDIGNAGWSCIVSNYGGADLQIDINDASSWYSMAFGGGQGNPMIIKKYTTIRITLVYSSIDNQYIWSAPQFF